MVQRVPTRLLTTISPDAPVDSALLQKALLALIKNHQKTSEQDNTTSLLGSDLPVQVQFTLLRVPDKTSSRPICLDIPHPLHKLITDENDDTNSDIMDDGLDDVEVCLIVKDEAKQWVKDLIQKFPSHLSYIKKVITLTSLRKKHSQYADRRELVKRYDLFLADDRILPMLGKALGKSFFQQKKQPVPIKVTRKEALPFAVKRCLRGTFMWVSAGTCVTIKAGSTAMPTQYLKENVESIVKNAVSHIPRTWANISSISIKTSKSISLPIYNKTREDLEEIAYLHQIAKKDTKEKKREISAQSEEKIDTGRDQKKQKVDIVAKSPLLTAIKTMKNRDEKSEEESTKIEKDQNAREKPKEKKKRKKKHASSNADETRTNKKIKEEKKDEGKSPRLDETSKKASTSTEKKQFISSSKFKKAKPGYVFKKGANGVGYYLDVKPAVMFSKVVRSNRGEGSSRSKSPGGKRRKSGGRNRR